LISVSGACKPEERRDSLASAFCTLHSAFVNSRNGKYSIAFSVLGDQRMDGQVRADADAGAGAGSFVAFATIMAAWLPHITLTLVFCRSLKWPEIGGERNMCRLCVANCSTSGRR